MLLKGNVTHPTAVAGDENCLRDTLTFNRANSWERPHALFRISVFRRPRAHVVSQFVECRAEAREKAKFLIHMSAFDRTAAHTLNALKAQFATAINGSSAAEAFDAWLSTFAADRLHHAWGCYSPWNMQARAMTCCSRPTDQCANTNTHTVWDEPEPSASAAVAALEHLDVVGLTEAYAATLCLITHRLGRLPRPSCFCDAQVAAGSAPGSRSSRASSAGPHVPRLRSAVKFNAKTTLAEQGSARLTVDAVSHLLPTIDALTAVDRVLYDAAVARFRRDIEAMERRFGRRMLPCYGLVGGS